MGKALGMHFYCCISARVRESQVLGMTSSLERCFQSSTLYTQGYKVHKVIGNFSTMLIFIDGIKNAWLSLRLYLMVN